MTAVLSMSPGSAGISEREHLALLAHPRAPESRRPLVDVSAELLRTIAEVLDIRGVFPRVSEIVQHALRHDGLELVLCDRTGHVTLEARSTDDLAGLRGFAASDDEAFYIVSDLQRSRARLVGREADVIDDLVAAGYRSILSIRSVARHQVMRLGFFSKQPDAFGATDVSTAQQIADYVAMAVAHEQLAAAECDRAEARGRTGRVGARVRALTDRGEAVSGRGRMIGRSEAWQRVLA
jgi:GAF domain-containing protein